MNQIEKFFIFPVLGIFVLGGFIFPNRVLAQVQSHLRLPIRGQGQSVQPYTLETTSVGTNMDASNLTGPAIRM